MTTFPNAAEVAVSPEPRVSQYLQRNPGRLNLAAFQLLSIPMSAAICAIEVETVIVSQGLALSGVLLAAVTFRQPMTRWFGLSCLGATGLVYAMILFFGLGPREAQLPVTILLIVLECGMIPLGLLSLYELKTGDARVLQWRWRFRLKSLLAVMLAIALGAAVVRAFAPKDPDEILVALAIVLAIYTWVGAGLVLWLGGRQDVRNHAWRRRLDESRRRFGRRVSEIRNARGIGLEELAAASAIPVAPLRRIEQGRERVVLDDVIRLSAALHVAPFELIDGIDGLESHDDAASTDGSPHAAEAEGWV